MNKLSYFGDVQKVLIITAFIFLAYEEAHLHFKGAFSFFICSIFFSSFFSIFLASDQITHMTNDIFHNVNYADSYILWESAFGCPFIFHVFRILPFHSSPLSHGSYK